MSNRIVHIDLRDRSVVPAEAEVHITCVPEFITGGTEVRGRLMGPRCRFASTVEVAYHLRKVLMPTSRPALTLKAIIPEASLWEPETPHLYAGLIELWQDGVRCEVVPVRHGLRQVGLGPRGLRLNGRPIHLTGCPVAGLNDNEGLTLREKGYNLLLAPVSDESRHVWEVADRLGFFVLGRVEQREQAALTQHLTGHPCCLGWLLQGEEVTLADVAAAPLIAAQEQGNFVTMSKEELLAGPPVDRPVLVIGSGEVPVGEGGPVVLGVVPCPPRPVGERGWG